MYPFELCPLKQSKVCHSLLPFPFRFLSYCHPPADPLQPRLPLLPWIYQGPVLKPVGWLIFPYLRDCHPHLHAFAQTSSQWADSLLKVACWLCTLLSLPSHTWYPFLPCLIFAFIHTTYLPWLYHIIHIYCVYCLSTPTKLEISWGQRISLFCLLKKTKCHQESYFI